MKKILVCLVQTYKGCDGMPDAENKRRGAPKKKSVTGENSEKVIRRRKRRRRNRFISFLFIILMILCACLIVIKTPLFDVENITVEGDVLVTEEDILKVAGIAEGQNIFDHLSSYYEERILSLPYVSAVEVEKKIPSEIHITILEEYEYAVIDFQGVGVICDKYGKTIRIAKDEDIGKYIKFTGCKEGLYDMGGYVKLKDEEETGTLLRCLAAIEDYGFSDVTKVDMADKDDIVFTVEDTLTVKIGELGDEDELSYKMAYIKEVIDSLPHGISGIIDATNPEAGISYRTGEYDRESDSGDIKEEQEEISGGGEETLSDTDETETTDT